MSRKKKTPHDCVTVIPKCPEHGLDMTQVILEGCSEECHIGSWSCPIDKRTGKPMDDSISCENPLPEEAACNFFADVTWDKKQKKLVVAIIQDDDID